MAGSAGFEPADPRGSLALQASTISQTRSTSHMAADVGLGPTTLRLMVPETRLALVNYLLTRYYSLGMVCLTTWLF